MPDKSSSSGAMGDIIGSARRRLEQPEDDAAARLKSLVAATPTAQSTSTPTDLRNQSPASIPGNYFHQINEPASVTPKRKPQRGPARSLHISMRLSPPERDRIVRWCDERNLSLPDGIVALLDLAEGKGPVIQ